MRGAELLRVLARSATGQEMSVYTTFSSGPRRNEDLDGPSEYHVVLLDNGRSEMLGNEFHEMLRCIRGGACMNHCGSAICQRSERVSMRWCIPRV